MLVTSQFFTHTSPAANIAMTTTTPIAAGMAAAGPTPLIWSCGAFSRMVTSAWSSSGIAEKPRHGYEIIKEIEERVAGAFSPGPGVIYPTLTPWEEPGYIAVSPGEAVRKLHETPRRDEHFSPPTDR